MSDKNSIAPALNIFFIIDLVYKLLIAYLLFLFVPLVFNTISISYFAYVIIIMLSSIVYDNLASGALTSFLTNIFNFIVLALIYIFYKNSI